MGEIINKSARMRGTQGNAINRTSKSIFEESFLVLWDGEKQTQNAVNEEASFKFQCIKRPKEATSINVEYNIPSEYIILFHI